MTSQPAGEKWTYEDLLLLPDDGKRYEILDGELFVTASPYTRHQEILGRLFLEVANYLRGNPLGRALFAPADVVLSRHDVVEPDLLFVAAERDEIVTERNIQGPPDLAVEVLSESTRKTDEVLKRRRYEQFGVREYWIVDPVVETVKIYRLAGASYERAAELSAEAGDTLTTPLLPGLSISLPDLFRP